MSTFDGKVIEFPDIRIDYFRVAQNEVNKPLALFLSHVHSDHLAGLESCKSPFIYCSPATREILLRLEKYPHRMNFAKGILEARKQTYRHLKNLLKPIPLETPTTLELAPGRSIRVTLFDANHCIGAVTFLIEDERRAIIYTGDVRSEQWWVDSLVRHPILLPYAVCADLPSLKKLDCMYLDTTFASNHPHCRKFPTKRDGVVELLRTVAKYPSDTVFYFNSWTFGYEEVWESLSASLRTRVHVDDYRFGLYSALSRASGPKAEEVHRLIGFYCGNHFQEGCLTRTQTRLHSCEQGTGCKVLEQDYVRITPIIGRYKGQDILELGAGGGHGDLDQQHELELGDQSTVQQLIMLCRDKLHDTPALLEAVETLLQAMLQPSTSTTTIPLDANVLHNDASQSDEDVASFNDLPIDNLVPAIVAFLRQKQESKQGSKTSEQDLRPDGLPKRIRFPYSRHSSLEELCALVEAFQPTELHPCTVDCAQWTSSHSMSHLFGHLYPSDKSFRHDNVMRQRVGKRTLSREFVFEEPERKRAQQHVSATAPVLGSPFRSPQNGGNVNRPAVHQAAEKVDERHSDIAVGHSGSENTNQPVSRKVMITSTTTAVSDVPAIPYCIEDPRNRQSRCSDHDQIPSNKQIILHDTTASMAKHATDIVDRPELSDTPDRLHDPLSGPTNKHIASPSDIRRALRLEAYAAALGQGDLRWDELNLISVGKSSMEDEL